MSITPQGYVRNGGVIEHTAIAERAFGGPLPPGAQIHHWNGVRTDNRPENLVICPSAEYHIMLHYREKALRASGNANYCKCEICKVYDDPAHLVRQDRGKSGIRYRHKACHAARENERAKRKRQLRGGDK
jgi:hypothetical protein